MIALFYVLDIKFIKKFYQSCFISEQKNQKQEVVSDFLSSQEIIKRLRIDNKDVIETVYSLSHDLLYREFDRKVRLDDKANNFLTLIGVYITLVFGLVGISLRDITPSFWLTGLVFLLLGTLLFSFASLFFSFQAIRARDDYEKISEINIFNKEMLGGDNLEYKRYLTVHFEEVYKNNSAINQQKGEKLKEAARMFFCSLVFLLCLIILFSIFILQKGGAHG